jgi:hypothetical protein
MRSDYSRAQDELKGAQDAVAQYKGQLDEWWQENQARLAAQPAAPITPAAPVVPNANVLTREDMLKELQTREQAAVAAIVSTNELASRHFATFHEPLNIRALMADPEVTKLGLEGVYDKVYKTQYADLAKKADDDRITKLVQERLAEERKQYAVHPYPVTGREPSALDAIEASIATPADPSKPVTPPVGSIDVVDQAVQQYMAAQSRELGVPH